MSNILLVTSSARSASYSTKVARSLAEQLASVHRGASITVRDLARKPLPHIDDTFAAAREIASENQTPAQRDTLALSDQLVAELFAADTIVIAAGMVNFGIPSTLKAYIDHIARPRVTFRYSEKGPEGLVKNKKVYLVVARGAVYSQGPMQALNFQDTYLRSVLSFLGLTDIEVITVEGAGFGPDAAERAVNDAMNQVTAIAA